MLGKIWKKALVLILIIACLFNIIRKVVRKKSLREELQATLDYFNARNEKTQENIIETNNINNKQKDEKNSGPVLMQQQNTNNQQVQNNNQQTQSNTQQQTEQLMPITQSEIEQNMQANSQSQSVQNNRQQVIDNNSQGVVIQNGNQ